MQSISVPVKQFQFIPPIEKQENKINSKTSIVWKPQSEQYLAKEKNLFKRKRNCSYNFVQICFLFLVAVACAGMITGSFFTQSPEAYNSFFYHGIKENLYCSAETVFFENYSHSFLLLFILNGCLFFHSFSCFGFIPNILLIFGKGVVTGFCMTNLYISQPFSLVHFLGIFPYHIFSFCVMLFLSFVSIKQSVKLFQIHILKNKKEIFLWADSWHLLIIGLAISFFSSFLFAVMQNFS